jgi:hypothetical protein
VLAILCDQAFPVFACAISTSSECVEFSIRLCVDRSGVASLEEFDAFLDSELALAALVKLRFDSIECNIIAGFEWRDALTREVMLEVLFDQQAPTLIVDATLHVGGAERLL